MKRMYEKPMASIETFISNEYVAACYSLSCKIGKYTNNPVTNDIWDNTESGPNRSHAASGTGNCSDPGSNYITVDSNGKFLSLEEWRSDLNNGKGAFLHGRLDRYEDLNGDGKCGPKDYIAWTTSYTDKNGTREWHHWGYTQVADSAHPNHS